MSQPISRMVSPFEVELEQLINKYSRENHSHTPDFILAEYMMSCLKAFEDASNRREEWYGKQLRISHD